MMEAAPVMTKARLGRALSRALDGADATILSELGVPLDAMELARHGCWYQEPHSGGLGWSFPAALGMKLADRERMVVATMGDGSYIFANPTACHQIAEALELPILAVIVNNGEWGAVRNAVLGLYPEGAAAKANVMPLTSLAPSPDFVQVAQASRAWARRVDDPSEVENALREAIAHVRTQKSMALVDVKVAP
jgi:acetolactate synthase-1/2/3 large subunit